VTALHDGADQHAGSATAGAVYQYDQWSGDAERLNKNAALLENDVIRPAGPLKIGGARCIIGK
jgi:hypothetical protein